MTKSKLPLHDFLIVNAAAPFLSKVRQMANFPIIIRKINTYLEFCLNNDKTVRSRYLKRTIHRTVQ